MGIECLRVHSIRSIRHHLWAVQYMVACRTDLASCVLAGGAAIAVLWALAASSRAHGASATVSDRELKVTVPPLIRTLGLSHLSFSSPFVLSGRRIAGKAANSACVSLGRSYTVDPADGAGMRPYASGPATSGRMLRW